MRIYVIVTLALLLIYLAYRKYLEPEKYMITISLVTVILLISGYTEFRWQSTEHQANRVAISIAGERAGYLRCQRLSETMLFAGAEAGHVMQNQDGSLTGMLTYQVCRDLGSWLRSDKTDTSIKIAQTLHIIVHESVHLTGEFDESKTECVAMAQDVKAFQLLGAPQIKATILANDYRDKIYPLLSSNYNSLKC